MSYAAWVFVNVCASSVSLHGFILLVLHRNKHRLKMDKISEKVIDSASHFNIIVNLKK